MPFCEYCGEQMDREQAFCSNCGHAVDNPDHAYQPTPTESIEPMQGGAATVMVTRNNRHRTRNIFIAIGALVLVAAVVVAVLLLLKPVGAKNPRAQYLKSSVEEAISDDVTPQEALSLAYSNSKALINEIFDDEDMNVSTDFSLSLDLSGVDLGGSMEASYALAMLSTFSMDGSYVSNPEDSSGLLEVSGNISGIEMMSFFLTASNGNMGLYYSDTNEYYVADFSDSNATLSFLDGGFMDNLMQTIIDNGTITVENAVLTDDEGNEKNCLVYSVSIDNSIISDVSKQLYTAVFGEPYGGYSAFDEADIGYEITSRFFVADDRIVRIDLDCISTEYGENIMISLDMLLGEMNYETSGGYIEVKINLTTLDFYNGTFSLTVEDSVELNCEFSFDSNKKSPLGIPYGRATLTLSIEDVLEQDAVLEFVVEDADGGANHRITVVSLEFPDEGISLSNAEIVLFATNSKATAELPDVEPIYVDAEEFMSMLSNSMYNILP